MNPAASGHGPPHREQPAGSDRPVDGEQPAGSDRPVDGEQPARRGARQQARPSGAQAGPAAASRSQLPRPRGSIVRHVDESRMNAPHALRHIDRRIGGRFPASIQLTKHEAFSVCEALADAGSRLSQLHMVGEASRLGGMIDLIESRLANGSRPFEEN